MISEEQLKDWACKVNENNDIPGKRYDWSKDFQFTDSVINDLKDRDLFKIGWGLRVLIPINRENAPNYYQKGRGPIRSDGKTYDGKEPNRHDFEPYDILHVDLQFDHKEKIIGIDRYYGHRKDWDGEGHTKKERDWTDVPPISKSTVDSIMNAYKDRGVTGGILRAIDEYIESEVKTDVGSEAMRRYKEKPNDPVFMEWLQRYIDAYSNSSYVLRLRNMCAKIESGEIFSYTYEFFEPEEPSEEYIAKKAENHRSSEESINRYLSDWYARDPYGD